MSEKDKEKKEQETKKINPKLINKHKLLSGRVRRANLTVEESKRDLTMSLKELGQKHTVAVREYEDIQDSIALKQIDDEDYRPTPDEKKELKEKKRKAEDIAMEVMNEQRRLDKELTDSTAYKKHLECEKELEEWLYKVCEYLKCAPDNIDWEKGTYEPSEEDEDIPEDLL